MKAETMELILESIRSTIREEAEALFAAINEVGEHYAVALDLILKSKGKVILIGIGKSGLVARKIAATMCSTGTLAIFMHPVEGMHGDLGIVTPEDVVIAVGKSGESEELNNILPALRKIGVKLIAITGNPNSTLAENAHIVLYAAVKREADPHNLAPTTSTTVALAIGDALAMALMKLKDFRPEDFAMYHPGGSLGRRLLLKVSDVMIPIENCPVLKPNKTTIADIIVALSSFGLGIVLFTDNGERLDGILTDGDIRRLLERHKAGIFDLNVDETINHNPSCIEDGVMAVEALRYMEERERPLNVLPVLRGTCPVGLVRLHELVRTV